MSTLKDYTKTKRSKSLAQYVNTQNQLRFAIIKAFRKTAIKIKKFNEWMTHTAP